MAFIRGSECKAQDESVAPLNEAVSSSLSFAPILGLQTCAAPQDLAWKVVGRSCDFYTQMEWPGGQSKSG